MTYAPSATGGSKYEEYVVHTALGECTSNTSTSAGASAVPAGKGLGTAVEWPRSLRLASESCQRQRLVDHRRDPLGCGRCGEAQLPAGSRRHHPQRPEGPDSRSRQRCDLWRRRTLSRIRHSEKVEFRNLSAGTL